MGASRENVTRIDGVLPMEVADYIQNRKRNELVTLENRYGVSINIVSDNSLPPGGGKLEFKNRDDNNS